mgnify:CR=1 FL=1
MTSSLWRLFASGPYTTDSNPCPCALSTACAHLTGKDNRQTFVIVSGFRFLTSPFLSSHIWANETIVVIIDQDEVGLLSSGYVESLWVIWFPA